MIHTTHLFENEARWTDHFTAALSNLKTLSEKPKRKPSSRSIWELESDCEDEICAPKSSRNLNFGSVAENEKLKLSSAHCYNIPYRGNSNGIWDEVEDIKYPPRKEPYRFQQDRKHFHFDNVEKKGVYWPGGRDMYSSNHLETKKVIDEYDTRFLMEQRKLSAKSLSNVSEILFSKKRNDETLLGKPEKLESKDSSNDNMDVSVSKTRFFTPEKDIPRKRQCLRNEGMSQNISNAVAVKLSDKFSSKIQEEKYLNLSKIETESNLIALNNLSPQNDIKSYSDGKELKSENVQKNFLTSKNLLEASKTEENQHTFELNSQSVVGCIKTKLDENTKENYNNWRLKENITEKLCQESKAKKISHEQKVDFKTTLESKDEVAKHSYNGSWRSQNYKPYQLEVKHTKHRVSNDRKVDYIEKEQIPFKKKDLNVLNHYGRNDPPSSEWLRMRVEQHKSQITVDLASNRVEGKNSPVMTAESDRKTKKSVSTNAVSLAQGEFSMVSLHVSGLSKGNELTVPKEVLPQVKVKYPKAARMIPKVNIQVNDVPYSGDAVIIVLRHLFSLTHSIPSSKIALEVLSMAKSFSLSRLQDYCVKYLAENPPTFENVEELLHCASYFNVLQDFNQIHLVEKLSVYQYLINNPSVSNYKISPCSIVTKKFVEPFEFCLPLRAVVHEFNGVFEADVSNKLIFKSVRGSFTIVGIQIKLNIKKECNKNISIVYSVLKNGKSLIDEKKDKRLKSSIYLSFKREIVVKSSEKIEINITMEDIQRCLCSCVTKPECVENGEDYSFKTVLSSNQRQSNHRPLIFIEKLFYIVSV